MTTTAAQDEQNDVVKAVASESTSVLATAAPRTP